MLFTAYTSTAKEHCNEDSEEEGFVAGYREKLSQATPHISEAQQYLFENARV